MGKRNRIFTFYRRELFVISSDLSYNLLCIFMICDKEKRRGRINTNDAAIYGNKGTI